MMPGGYLDESIPYGDPYQQGRGGRYGSSRCSDSRGLRNIAKDHHDAYYDIPDQCSDNEPGAYKDSKQYGYYDRLHGDQIEDNKISADFMHPNSDVSNLHGLGMHHMEYTQDDANQHIHDGLHQANSTYYQEDSDEHESWNTQGPHEHMYDQFDRPETQDMYNMNEPQDQEEEGACEEEGNRSPKFNGIRRYVVSGTYLVLTKHIPTNLARAQVYFVN